WLRAEREREHAERGWQHADDAKKSADQAARDEALARREVERMTTRLTIAAGLDFAERGEVGRGLLWLARALEKTPPDDRVQHDFIRRSLDAWRASLHPQTMLVSNDPERQATTYSQ